MGLNLVLFVSPTKRIRSTWEAAFHDTVNILQQFWVDPEITDDHWNLAGFTLYRDQQRQFASGYATVTGTVGHPPGIPVLAGNTVEVSVYDAILGTALFLERQYLPDALLYGHIVRDALTRTEPVIGSYKPVCTDGPALLRLLENHYSSQPIPPRHFRELFLGDPVSMFTAATDVSDRLFLNTLFTEELQQYSSLRQRGAERIVQSFFQATGDIARLVCLTEAVNLVHPGGFTCSLLLQALCRGGIAADPAVAPPGIHNCVTDPVKAFPRSLLETYFDEAATETPPYHHIHRDALFEIFSSLDPTHRNEFARIIQQSTSQDFPA